MHGKTLACEAARLQAAARSQLRTSPRVRHVAAKDLSITCSCKSVIKYVHAVQRYRPTSSNAACKGRLSTLCETVDFGLALACVRTLPQRRVQACNEVLWSDGVVGSAGRWGRHFSSNLWQLELAIDGRYRSWLMSFRSVLESGCAEHGDRRAVGLHDGHIIAGRVWMH